MDDFFTTALQSIHCARVTGKQNQIAAMQQTIACGIAKNGASQLLSAVDVPVDQIPEAGRPTLPILVHPTEVKRRRLGSVAGRIALLHAIAHIEFNAINLALDACYRFRQMPLEYYRDWLCVAHDETRHFLMLQNRLVQLGSYYGALPAHGGLWAMAVATDYDVIARMALVPRVLEARGLDVTPAMIRKLHAVGDNQSVEILQLILAEEVRHVSIGNRWFEYVCQQRQQDTLLTFSALLRKHGRIALRGPFNREARLAAGFSLQELQEIDQIEKQFREEHV